MWGTYESTLAALIYNSQCSIYKTIYSKVSVIAHSARTMGRSGQTEHPNISSYQLSKIVG